MALDVISLTAIKGYGVAKGAIVASGTLAGFIGFTFAELITGKTWAGLAVAAVFSVIATFIKTRPKVIEATANADTQIRAQVSKEAAELWERSNQLHAEQVLALVNQNGVLLDRFNAVSRRVVGMIITKHELSKQNNALGLRVRNLEEMLSGTGVTVEPFVMESVEPILDEEDRLMAESVGIDIDEVLRHKRK